ncbi:9215_t:CDS:1, partial [Funneliformis geosporum]
SNVSINEIENPYQIEYLPPVDTKDLLKVVRAAIYLSLDKLWDVPNELSLIATILDPRLKNFRFINNSDRREQIVQAETCLKGLYIELKQKLTNLEEIREESSTPIIVEDDDIFANMWISDQQFTQ